MLTAIVGILEEGFAYAIMALGVYITYKLLDFPDLTVDGSFPLGAAVTVVLLTKGVNPLLALLLSFGAGAVAGIVTGLIHVKFHVRDLLSGIIVMTGLYTINLRIAGKANIPLLSSQTLFDNQGINAIFNGGLAEYKRLFVLVIAIAACKILLDLYLKTKSGFLLRAAGDNAVLVTSLAKDSGYVKIAGLAIANGLVGLSGSIVCQKQRFFEISMGTGTVVTGLAIVIIGTKLFARVSFMKATTAVILGSVLYKMCTVIAIRCGLSTTDMKLVTAMLFLVILVASNYKKKKVI